jgi:hypothetical protein
MNYIKPFIVFLFAFILVALLFELLLNFGGILSPIVRIDPEYGERYIPNKLTCSMFVNEGFGLAETNSSGWFGKQFKDRGKNDISIGVVGGSWVASRQVFYRDNFLTIAEKAANEKLEHKHISLYNYGKDDLPLKEMLYIKNQISSTYNPDRILILINKGNFREDSQRNVAFFNIVNRKFELDTSFKQKPLVKNYSKFQLLTKSSLLFLCYRVKNNLSHIGEIVFDKFYFSKDKKIEQEEIEDPIKPDDRAIIEELAKDKKIIFLLNLEGNLFEIVKSFVGQAPIINLQPALKRMYTEGGIDPYYWKITNEKGHWNIPAHKVVGQEIATQLVEIVNSN